MTNPFNPQAGDTPAPVDPRERELVEQSSRVIWRAFPYFAWRYGERGRSFGRSDAGYLATLLQLDEAAGRAQVAWLTTLLAARGMPSLLLEVQLESLGRLWRRAGRAPGARFYSLAAEMRRTRMAALDPVAYGACERLCRSAARGLRERRGTGLLIAAAVADRASGIGAYEDALVQWFTEAAPGDAAWSTVCADARILAHTYTKAGV